MRLDMSLLWTWNRTIGRGPYLLTGAVLFAVKYVLDWCIAQFGFAEPWTPLNYLIWPNDRTLRVLDLGADDRVFALTMLIASLPFIWIGVVLTLHRLRDAGAPLWLVVLFFVPLVNLLMFLVLSVLQTKQPVDVIDASLAEPEVNPYQTPHVPELTQWQEMHRRITKESYWLSGLAALMITVPLTAGGVVLGAEVLQSYGFSLFVGGPFALGMISVLLFGFSRPQPFWACFLVATGATTLAGVAILLVAIEGAICLIMAAPIVYPLAFMGCAVGYAIQSRPWLSRQGAGISLLLLLVLPGLMGAESADEPSPQLRAVRTEVIIAASPEQVWPNVIAFPPLPEPEEWLFRTGIAYPQRAEIHGQGVGSVRHCVFSTGAFVEPIDVWQEPELLRFRVTEQPAPMEEWSPYHIHPPHLDHYLVSHQGEFLLERLDDGGTRLVGTTWYTNRMWPAAYWHLWSDYMIHRIHLRVLRHIEHLSQENSVE